MAATKRTRKQRAARREGFVRRLEIVLHSDDERDHEIHEFLEALPRGRVSEFVRQALYAAIVNAPPPAPPASGANAADQLDALYHRLATQQRESHEQLDAMYKELAALREEVSRSRPDGTPQPATDARATAERVSAPDQAMEEESPDDGLVASSGLDTSRRRKRPGRPTVARPQTLPEEPRAPSYDARSAAAILFNSAKQFEQDFLADRGRRPS